ncbi:MAG: extracellular solute-binding protein [Planctomycetes bacterium]|nr:extracellular solute-binding protein [Planctomycetota bacterium]
MGTTLTFFVNEEPSFSRDCRNSRAVDCWQTICSVFRQQNPDLKVRLQLQAAPVTALGDADVVLLESGLALTLTSELAPWMESGSDRYDLLIAPVADEARRNANPCVWPVAFGSMVLFANKKALTSAGLFEPGSWSTPAAIAETCVRYFAKQHSDSKLGWAYNEPFEPLSFWGFGRHSLEADRADILRFLQVLAESPANVIATGVNSFHSAGLVGLLHAENVLFVTGHLWNSPIIDKTVWVDLPLPLAALGYGFYGSMSLGISKHSRFRAEALRFLRFVAGPTGQEIIAASGGLAPTLESVGHRHPLKHLIDENLSHGWMRIESQVRPHLANARGWLIDVREGRMTPDGALERILAVAAPAPENAFSLAQPAPRSRHRFG